ncbi:MAG: LamG-like jellyroll fold domain-containing protein [Alphaproteobacteria bacterium]
MPALTSNGVPITYTNDGQTITGSAGGDPIFTMQITGGGTGYTFTLQGQIDHPEGAGENEIDIPFTVTATDSDGSVDSTTFHISVVDDVPLAVDDGVFTTEEGGPSITGNLMDNDHLGADDPVTVTEITYTDANGALQTQAIDADGETVTTEYGALTVASDGSFTFVPNDGIDHQGAESVFTSFDYTIVDNDGDASSATATLEITDDSEPTISFPPPGSRDGDPVAPQGEQIVDEDDLDTDDGDNVDGSDQNNVHDSTTGQKIFVTFGPDGPAANDPLVFEDPAVSGDLAAKNLTSGGEALTYTMNAEGTQITGSAGGDTIFTMTLTGNPDDGFAYEFDLVGQLDHAQGQGENLIEDIPFKVIATDSDGDTATGPILVDVKDDVPVARDDGDVNLGECGSGSGGDLPEMDHDISNIVLYVADNQTGEITKVKIEGFDAMDGVRDPDHLPLQQFIDENYPDSTLVAGLTVKAGNNATPGYGPGEGELFITADGYTAADLPTADKADDEWNATDAFDGMYIGPDNPSLLGGGGSVSVMAGTDQGHANLLDNDTMGADGAEITSFTYTGEDGQQHQASAGDTVDTIHGTLTVNSDGSWSYTVDAQVANDAGVASDTFTYTLTDDDGDTSQASQTINIADGCLNIDFGANGTAILDEDDLSPAAGDLADGTDGSDASIVSKDFTVEFGADGPAASGAVVLSVPQALEDRNLTSDGDPVEYTVSSDGQTLTASAGGETVFTVSLSGDPASGTMTYTFDLVGELDHATGDGENVISDLPVTVTITDGDGSQESGNILLNVVDDVPAVAGDPVVLGQAESVSVDEDDLADGTDDDKESLSASGDLGFGSGDVIGIDYGADGPADGAPSGVGYSDLDFTIEGPAGLTSQGEAITYSQTGNVLTAEAGGREVFTVELNADGTYTFELKDSIDHEDADGENVENLSFSMTGVPSAEVLAAAVDGDGDPVTGLADASVTQTFAVNVVDDVPTAVANELPPGGAEEQIIEVTNMGQESAAYNNTYGYYIKGPNGEPTSGEIIFSNTKQDIGETVTIEGHDPADVGFFVISNGASLNPGIENGMEVTFSQDGSGNWVASTVDGPLSGQGDPVLFSDPALNEGNFDYTEDNQIAGNQNWEDIPGGGDNDFNDVNINVETITITSTPTVDEDDLADGSSPDAGALAVDGNLGLAGEELISIDYGADGPADGAPSGLGYDDLVFTIEGPQGLTSQGEAIEYDNSTPGELTATAGGREIFTVSLNEDGTFTFTLKDTVDHENADGQNVETLNFGLSGVPAAGAITDYDLDPASMDGVTFTHGFAVNVIDDVPSAADDDSAEVEEGHSTSGSVIDNDVAGADGATVTEIAYTDAGGNAATATVDPTDGVTVETQYGSLTIGADGSYTFTANDEVTSGGQSVTEGVTYTLTDFDGDTSQAVLDVTITDDGEPTIEIFYPDPDDPNMGVGGAFVDEDDLGVENGDTDQGTDQSQPSSVSGTIAVNAGEDGLGSIGLSVPPALVAMGLTSGGTALAYSVSGDGSTITADADGDTVFTMTLTGNEQDGFGWSFDLTGNLDHADGQGENVIADLPFTVTVTDTDGDAASGTILVDVVDDVPVASADETAIGTAETVSVDEDDLADGTDGDKESLSATGDLGLSGGDLITIDYGADGAADGAPSGVGYGDLDFTIEGPAGLTSQGEAITYSQEGDVLTATAGGREVFTVTLNGDGSFTFELKDSIDHEDANGQNVEDLGFTLTGVPNAETIAAAIDNDGDPASGLADASVTQTFAVNVVDDVPVATVNELTVEGGEPVILTGRIDSSNYSDGDGGYTVLGRQIDANGDLSDPAVENISVGSSTGGSGIGVKGTPESGVAGQLGYDPTEAVSEEIIINFDYEVTSFSFTVANLFETEYVEGEGIEEGHVVALKDGQVVAEFDFDANMGSNQGSYSFDLPEGVTIDQVIFTANPYQDGIPDGEDGQTTTGDSSDYWITGIDFEYIDPNSTGGETEVTAEMVMVDEDDLTDGSDDDKEGLSATGDLNIAGEDLISIDYGADGPADGAPTALQYEDLEWTITGPEGLTSQGADVTYTYDSATDTLQASADGRDVFTVQLNADGSYTFTLQDTLDHPEATAEDILALDFGLSGVPADGVATDFDLDPAALNGLSFDYGFQVKVVDDVPTAVDDGTYTTEEGGASVTGNLMDNDTLGADDPVSVTSITYTDANGNTQTQAIDADGETVSTQYGDLTVSADGSFTFTPNDAIDHQGADSVSESFTYTIADFDGDESTATAVLEISDDSEPGIKFPPPGSRDGDPSADTGSQIVDEDDLDTDDGDNVDGTDQDGTNNSLTGQAIYVNFGSDGPAANNPLVFEDPAASGDLAAKGLTSEGQALTYTINGDGTQITGSAGGDTIFTMTIETDGQGSFAYNFDLVGQLDHAEGDGQNLIEDIPFKVIATDSDGDKIEAAIEIDVVDDVPVVSDDAVVIGQAESVSVDEDDLADGTDDTKESLSATGDLGFGSGNVIGIDYGADGAGDGAPAGVTFADLDFTIEGPAGLTSQGEAVTYSQTGNVLTAEAGGREIFTVEVNGDGSYTFTLKDSIDHEDANGQNIEDLGFTLTGTPNAATLAAAVDGDGDPVDGLSDASVTQTFAVSVVDDVPSAVVVSDGGGEVVNVTIDISNYDDTDAGFTVTGRQINPDGTLTDKSGDLVSTHSNPPGFGVTGAASGDQAEIGYSDNHQISEELHIDFDVPVTEATVTYSWMNSQEDGTLTLYRDGQPVGTLTVDGVTDRVDEPYTVQADDGGPFDAIVFTAPSGGGHDFLVHSVEFEMVVDGGSSSTSVTLDEDDLIDGTDDDKEGLSATGETGLGGRVLAEIDYGADGPADGSPESLDFDDFDFTITGPDGLTSQGEAVTYSQSGDVLTATAGGREVFTVELNADGSYTFTLKDSLDHAPADGENLLPIEFSLSGTPKDGVLGGADFDQDPVSGSGDLTVTQSFTVNVVDDVPEAVVNDLPSGGNEQQLLQVTNMGQESAAYENTYGFYVKGANGEPTTGKIIFANTKEDIGETVTIEGYGPEDVGFFVIPNGFTANGGGLTNGQTVTFEQDGSGDWHAVSSGSRILGTGDPVLFSNPALNENSFDYTVDNSLPGNQNWEDIAGGGDLDFNDVNINVESFTYTSTPTVDEDDLADGTSPDAGALTVDGNLGLAGEELITVNYGADGPADGAPESLGYGDLDFTITGPAGLTSQGEEVTYDNSTPGVLTASAGGREVFTVSLNEDGSFTFTLKDTIDHQSGQGQNTQLLNFGLLGVPAAAVVTDFDLDPAVLDGLAFTHDFAVNVIDDVPSALNDDSLTVTEGDGAVSGNVMTNDTEGADGATLTSFTYRDANGDEQTASAGDTVETETGTLTVQADGSYTFQVKDSVVHDTNGQSESESFTYTITDADGDTAQATATIDILDTDPEVDAIAAPANGLEDNWIQLNMDSALLTTEGPENLTITITGVPAGAQLNPGTEVSDGVWTATPQELPSVCILPPQDFSGEINLTLTVSTTDVDGDTDTDSETFTVFVAPVVDEIELTTQDATAVAGDCGPDGEPQDPSYDLPEMDHAISNIVLYLSDEAGNITKVKIEGFPGGDDEIHDPDHLPIQQFVDQNYPNSDLVGALTVKAGNNKTPGYGPGEGELFIVDESFTEDGLPTADHADAEWQFSSAFDGMNIGPENAGTLTSGVDVSVGEDGTLSFDIDQYGTSGNDVMTGTSDNDGIASLAGDDTVTGLEGDDTILGGSGNDTLIGDGVDGVDGIVTVGEPTVVFHSSFETIPDDAQQQSDSMQAPEIDGWKSTGEGVEIWLDTAERDLGSQPDGTTTAADGDVFVELNNVPSDAFVDSDGIYRDIQTEAGKIYELTFSYSGRPGYDETVNKMAVSVDGDQLGEYSHDMEHETDHDWQTVTVKFTGTGQPMRIEFSETSDNDDAHGRGMSLDNIILTDTGTMVVDGAAGTYDDTIYGGADDDIIEGNQGDDVLYGDDPVTVSTPGCYVAPVTITAADTDIDGSEEVLTIEIGNIPEGASLVNAAGDTFSGSNVHVLTPDQLEGLQIEFPQGTEDFTLSVEVTVMDTDPDRGTTDTGTKSGSLTITVPDGVPNAGDPGDDTITGGSGNDHIYGQGGNDAIWGDDGPGMQDPGGEGEPEPQEPVEVTFTLGDPSYSDDPLGLYSNNGDSYARGYTDSEGNIAVKIGGKDDCDICDMAGGYTTQFNVDDAASDGTLTFSYRMTFDRDYESNEYGEVWVAIDGEKVMLNGNDYIHRVSGDGNGGDDFDSGWQTVTIDIGDLPAGAHSITLGGYNNQKTTQSEEMRVSFKDIEVTGMVGGEVTGGTDTGDVGAIFHFGLEEATWGESGETVVDSVNGLTGTAHGGVGSATSGDGSTAAQMDGNCDYIEIPHNAAMETTTGTFTMDFSRWNKGTLASKDSYGYDDGGHFDMDLTSGEVKLRIQTDSDSFELKGGNVEWDQWTNVAVTWDGSTVTLFVNGQAVDSVQSDWNMATNQNPWTFGASQVKSGDDTANNLEDYLNGKIDNPALFDGALTADQIAQMVSGGVANFVQNMGSGGTDDGGTPSADASYNDVIHGGTGDDQIHGQYGNDFLQGGAGNDLVTGGAGSDWIMGGTDTGSVTTGTGAITVTFQGTDAGYSNTVGYYVLDEEGTPQSGEVIWANLHQTDVGSTHTILLDGFDQDDVGFFLIPDGGDLNNGLADGATVTFGENADGSITVYADGQALQGQDADAYFSNPDELNPDGISHVQSSAITDGVGVTINTDGNDGYFEVQPTGMGGQQITVEVGFRSTDAGDNFTPIMSYSAGRNNGNEFTIGAQNGVLTVLVAGVSVATNILASGLFDGEDHMVSVSWDGSDGGLNVYVDGVSEFSTTGVATGQSILSGGTLIFGQEQDSDGGGFDANQTFSGSYTQARIFDDVRDGVEIAQNAGEPLPNDEDNVVADYHFGAYGNGSVSDASGNGNHLTYRTVDGFDDASDPTILVGNSGETLLGFEDLLNGGDQDYNDAILSVKPVPSAADFQAGDQLWGGEEGGTGDGEKDAFFYARGDGVDTIHDFEMGTDQLFISGYERDEMTVLKDGDDTIISLGDGGAIKLVGVDADLFGSEDNIATHDADTDGSGALNIDELMELKDDVMPDDGGDSSVPAADDAGIVMVAPVEPGLTNSGGNEEPQNG